MLCHEPNVLTLMALVVPKSRTEYYMTQLAACLASLICESVAYWFYTPESLHVQHVCSALQKFSEWPELSGLLKKG